MMKPVALITVALVTSLAGCASTTYKAYETRGDGVVEGKGGTKAVHDGMEVWDNGEPPRRFRILGVIEDERPGGIIPMSQLHSDIVKRAKEAGGDAVVQIRSQAQIVGYQNFGSATASAYGNTATASTFSVATPIRRNAAQFLVIKYLD